MENVYDPQQLKEKIKEHPDLPEELITLVYTSQLIGRDTNLVLHGGGNTSVKTTVKDLLGRDLEILFIKGSGQDLATIKADGFPRLRLKPLQDLQILDQLSDDEMVNQLLTNRIDSNSPTASIEGLLHAFLPFRYVNHSHADSILVLTNRPDGEQIVREVLGPDVVISPYRKPGFELAKGVAKLVKKHPQAEAVICMNHGIFTFGPDAETSYGRMIHYVDRAEQYIQRHVSTNSDSKQSVSGKTISNTDIVRLAQVIRGSTSFVEAAGSRRRFYIEIRNSPEMIAASLSNNAAAMCQSGVLTPDHALRTKNSYIYIDSIPEDDQALKEKISAVVRLFRDGYDAYFEKQVSNKGIKRTQLDNSPRVFMAAGVGLLTLGFSRKWAGIAADIAEHTIQAKRQAKFLAEYQAVTESHNFDLEYMTLQQQKLEK
ncbi:MAG: bifunctional aldolase/short-chain dehydrogenase, partial [Deltaproteobacteria bacterium]|nr:bifunctional aldolase/short-chain dehydrogenase [Deltaproteobacteria bacterium]